MIFPLKKARQTEEEHIYRIIFEFENKIVAEEVLYLAMDLINDLCRDIKYKVPGKN